MNSTNNFETFVGFLTEKLFDMQRRLAVFGHTQNVLSDISNAKLFTLRFYYFMLLYAKEILFTQNMRKKTFR